MVARETSLIDRVDTAALQDRLIGFIRAFGLHQPESTPCGQPIPVSEAHALSELAGDESLGQLELGRRLRLEKSTVSRLVGQLVGRGWVQRNRSLNDARAVLLTLTPSGHEAAAELAAARRQKFDRLMAAIPDTQRVEVLRALDVLTEALHAQP
ncbi:MAG: MarR family winged helix-turn-helix transcriptional regulator [Actinomycetota bacterium]|nr:MarR family winged helix-turn-helix transcriptional regulator [Actinomycetota bacterium]